MVTKKKKPTPKTSTKKTTKKVATRRRGITPSQGGPSRRSSITPSQGGNICGTIAYSGPTITIEMNSDECEGVTLTISNGSEIQCFWDGTQWVCTSNAIFSRG